MGALRAFLHGHRHLAAALIAIALAMKALLPAGYMIGASSRVLTVLICADASGAGHLQQMAIPLDRGDHGTADHNSKSPGDCPYAALSMAALGGADLALLMVALAFILALAFARAHLLPVRNARRLRPPLRGPPLSACPAHH